MSTTDDLYRLRHYLTGYASHIDDAARRPGRREHQLADGLATPVLLLDSIIAADAAAPSIVPGLVERIQWACKQIEHALADSRIDEAAAAWLRTIKDGLDNESGEMDAIRASAEGATP